MGFENDPYRDEDGEPLMDADEMQSDGEDSPLPGGRFDDDDEEDWQTGPSEAPAFDEDKVGKPRKRLVKKSGKESPPPRRGSPEPGLDDWIDDEVEEEEEAVPSSSKAKKRKASSIKEGKEGGGKDKRRTPSKAVKLSESSSKGFGGGSGDPDDVEEEMRELWNTVVGQDSENDEEVVRMADDDAFIDDTGVDPANRYGSDNEADFAGNAPQAEEGEEDDDELPIDLEQYDRREQLKKSGLGRSRPIFNKSTRYEDMRSFDNEKVSYRRPTMKKPVNKASGLESRDGDLDLGDFSQGTKSSQAAARRFTSRPEALPLDFLVRPQSKIDQEEIRARAKHAVQDQRRLKMNKKLQQLKAPKKKQLRQQSQASRDGEWSNTCNWQSSSVHVLEEG